MMKKILFCMVIGLFLGLTTAYSQEEWYFLPGLGQKGNRTAAYVDGTSIRKPETSGPDGITLVLVMEKPGSPQYVRMTAEYACDRNQMRTVNATALTYASEFVKVPDTDWKPVASGGMFFWLKEFACNNKAFHEARATFKNYSDYKASEWSKVLKKKGLPEMPLATDRRLQTLDRILDFHWDVFWVGSRPTITNSAKIEPKKSDPPQNSKGIAGGSKNAETAFQKGNEFFDSKMWGSAIEQYTQAIKLKPSLADAYVNRGIAYIYDGKNELAMDDLTDAIRLNSKNYLPHFHRANIYAKTGFGEQAVAGYSKVIDLKPMESASYYYRGLVYFMQLHQFDMAEADFTKTIELDPQFAEVFYMRANLYDTLGKSSPADADRKKFKSLSGATLPTLLYPIAEFKAADSISALETGNSSIFGKACSFHNGRRFAAAHVPVVLYPVTPYFEKWYELRKKKQGKTTRVLINKLVERYSKTAVSDQYGSFSFKGLKPGKYYLQTFFSFDQKKSERIYSGADVRQEGNVRTTTHYYYDRDYLVERNDRMEKFIEIKSDGESQEVTLKTGFGLGGC